MIVLSLRSNTHNIILGLYRDIFTHKTTTKEHWDMLMMPTVYTRAELDYDLVVGADTVVTDAMTPTVPL